MSGLVWYTGDLNPSITQTITIDGVAFNLSSSTVAFKMRAVGSTSQVALTGSTVVVDAINGQVRFDWGSGDTSNAGLFVCWWEVTTSGKVQAVGEAVIEFRAHQPFSTRALCTRGDVMRLVQGYDDNETTDGVLEELIAAESRVWHQDTGREFVTIAGATTRQFDIDPIAASLRRVRVGDMTTVTSVTTLSQDGTTQETIAASDRVSMPRIREEWEPITQLWFPPASSSPASTITAGNVLQVVGVWGFPAIPADIKMAVAQMSLYRYVTDPRSRGTQLLDALDSQDFNLGVAFASSQATKRNYMRPLVA